MGSGRVPMKSSAGPTGALILEDLFRVAPRWGNVARPLYPHIDQSLDEGCPRRKAWTWVKWLSSAKVTLKEDWQNKSLIPKEGSK